MKVKLADLKTNLSRYLRDLQRGGEPLEVCVREERVAFLTAARGEAQEANARQILQAQLEASGLNLSQWGSKSRTLPDPGRSRDKRVVKNSVADMRSEKGW